MIVLIILGFLFIIAGIVGCIIPVIPGPPLGYVGLLFAYFAISPRPFTIWFLLIMGIIMIIVTILDFILPPLMAKRYGASRYSSWGAFIGMILGLIFFPPFGIFIGAFIGAVLAEIIFNKKTKKSLKAGIGVFTGIISGIFLKLVTSSIFGYYFVKAVIKHAG